MCGSIVAIDLDVRDAGGVGFGGRILRPVRRSVLEHGDDQADLQDEEAAGDPPDIPVDAWLL
ncbi:MAG TPA: hypothetical protein DCQ20_01915 [Nitrospira sp.]|nr:hypothetical protein [Nitrospira sp.]